MIDRPGLFLAVDRDRFRRTVLCAQGAVDAVLLIDHDAFFTGCFKGQRLLRAFVNADAALDAFSSSRTQVFSLRSTLNAPSGQFRAHRVQ